MNGIKGTQALALVAWGWGLCLNLLLLPAWVPLRLLSPATETSKTLIRKEGQVLASQMICIKEVNSKWDKGS